MIELTEEQRQALASDEPPRLLDTKTQETYVLVRADVYDRIRAVLDGITRRAGWDDPKLNDYERYRKTS